MTSLTFQVLQQLWSHALIAESQVSSRAAAALTQEQEA